jgi:Carboxypeptidase regulatory-like domain
MYEFRHAKERAIARTSHKAFRLIEKYLLFGLMVAIALKAQQSSPFAPAWAGAVRTATGEPVGGAKVTVYTPAAKAKLTAVTGTDGRFAIANIRPGPHNVSVQLPGRGPTAPVAVDIIGITVVLTVSDQNVLSIAANPQTSAGVSNGNPSTTSNASSGTSGEKLSSQKVNELPLNGRDFSTLLLLAAGTMTDVNGQTNFTQQFAINGQRGVEAVFAMDGADVSDPEMGGSTFTNFNVDAIQELQSSSGWRTKERLVAASQLVLISPAALFMGSLIVRNVSLLQDESAHTAQQIVMWYSGRMWTLWALLIALPLSVLVTGCILFARCSNYLRLPQASRISF